MRGSPILAIYSDDVARIANSVCNSELSCRIVDGRKIPSAQEKAMGLARGIVKVSDHLIARIDPIHASQSGAGVIDGLEGALTQ